MATPTFFPKINFSRIKKASLADRVGVHVKNAGPQEVSSNMKQLPKKSWAKNGFQKKQHFPCEALFKAKGSSIRITEMQIKALIRLKVKNIYKHTHIAYISIGWEQAFHFNENEQNNKTKNELFFKAGYRNTNEKDQCSKWLKTTIKK